MYSGDYVKTIVQKDYNSSYYGIYAGVLNVSGYVDDMFLNVCVLCAVREILTFKYLMASALRQKIISASAVLIVQSTTANTVLSVYIWRFVLSSC